MVTVHISKKNDQYVSYEMTGHAEFDDPGKDLVCAAVSILAQNTLVSFEEVAGVSGVICEVEDGYLYGELPLELTKEQCHDCDVLFRSFETGIRGLVEIYPEHIKLIIEEVESNDDQI